MAIKAKSYTKHGLSYVYLCKAETLDERIIGVLANLVAINVYYWISHYIVAPTYARNSGIIYRHNVFPEVHLLKVLCSSSARIKNQRDKTVTTIKARAFIAFQLKYIKNRPLYCP